MGYLPQIKIPATYMRGGTSKGVFFNLTDLPESCQVAGQTRDNMLLRVIGSPDPYSKQIDGMGGATSSTSKTVIISKSELADHDVNYLFGQVAIDNAFVDWSGNCGNLTSAVGAFAISNGLVSKEKIPGNGIAVVKIWQQNIKKTIVAHVPITNGEVQETGDFELDGVTFSSAEIQIDFVEPVDASELMFPTGNVIDELNVPAVAGFESKNYQVTMINAGIPTVFLHADQLDYQGIELQNDINNDQTALNLFEHIRACAALKMGLIDDLAQAKTRQHTPKIAFVSPSASYKSSSGKQINKQDIDLNVRALSMGKLHHAMMGTAAVAIGTAAAIPGTIVSNTIAGGTNKPAMFELAEVDKGKFDETNHDKGIVQTTEPQPTELKATESQAIRFGHPSGTLKVGASTERVNGLWTVKKVSMSRSARVLMEGWVRIPSDSF